MALRRIVTTTAQHVRGFAVTAEGALASTASGKTASRVAPDKQPILDTLHGLTIVGALGSLFVGGLYLQNKAQNWYWEKYPRT